MGAPHNCSVSYRESRDSMHSCFYNYNIQTFLDHISFIFLSGRNVDGFVAHVILLLSFDIIFFDIMSHTFLQTWPPPIHTFYTLSDQPSFPCMKNIMSSYLTFPLYTAPPLYIFLFSLRYCTTLQPKCDENVDVVFDFEGIC